jgi:hypothetical protein
MELVKNAEILTLTERGMRFCRMCDKLLPIDQFKTEYKRRYLCHTHLNEQHKFYAYGTPEKRAARALRVKAGKDMVLLGQNKITISKAEIISMLNAEQVANITPWCILPKKPDEPLSLTNSVILLNTQRKYLLSAWNIHKDKAEYEDLLHRVLSTSKDGPN